MKLQVLLPLALCLATPAHGGSYNGFSVSSLSKGNPSRDAPLVFSKVENNDRDAYNSVTGEFTAPISGKYHFAAFLDIYIENAGRGMGMTDYGAALMLEDEGVQYTASRSDGGWETLSFAWILPMKAGQKVWIKNMYSSVTYDTTTSTFRGSLVDEKLSPFSCHS